MSLIVTKTEICKAALNRIGSNYADKVVDIDNPKDETEKTCAIWYDLTRQAVLTSIKPNFALRRRFIPKENINPSAFGYKFAYKYPVDCLAILGIGNIDQKRNDFGIEAGYILTDAEYVDGMPVRYVGDETNVAAFNALFKVALISALAKNIVLSITGNIKIQQLMAILEDFDKTNVVAREGQENVPIVIRRPEMQAAKTSAIVTLGVDKK